MQRELERQLVARAQQRKKVYEADPGRGRGGAGGRGCLAKRLLDFVGVLGRGSPAESQNASPPTNVSPQIRRHLKRWFSALGFVLEMVSCVALF